jgi:hypothetical protein
MGISVISQMVLQRGTPNLVSGVLSSVNGLQDWSKNLIFFGAKSSCKVQPLLNHASLRRLSALEVV